MVYSSSTVPSRISNCLLVFAGLCLCFFYTGASFASPEKVRIQLKWYHQFQFAGYYAAKSKGFYEEEGLDVELIEGTKGSPPDKIVLAGNAEFGVHDGGDLLYQRLKGDPLVAVATIFQHSPYVIVSKKQDGIRHPADLVGRTVLITQDQGSASILAMFRREGVKVTGPLDNEPVRFAPHTWDFDDVLAGRADAMSAYITEIARIARQYGVIPAVMNPLDYGIDYYGDTLFTSNAYLKAKPDVVARFRRASLKGWQYAMANPHELADAILQLSTVRQPKLDRQALLDEAESMKNIVLPTLVEIGNMNPGRWETMAKVYRDFGMVSSLSALQGFTYEADAEKQKIRTYLQVVGSVLAGITLLSLLGLFWLSQLKKQVNLRTRQLVDEIDERKNAEKKLSESELRLQSLIRAIPDLVWLKDKNGVYLSCNQRFESFFGALEKDIVGKTDYDFVSKDQADFFRARDKIAIESGVACVNEEWVSFADDGHRELLETTKTPLFDSENRIVGVLGVGHDITERARSANELRVSHERLKSILETTKDGFWRTDLGGSILEVNQSYCQSSGYARDELMRMKISDLDALESATDTTSRIQTIIQTGYAQFESTHRRKDGSTWPVEVSTTYRPETSGGEFFVFIRDITQRKHVEETINYLAFFDQLTDLPNRRLLQDRLKQAMASGQRSGHHGALLLIDLDHFKKLNDTLGHDMGDLLLQLVGQRLTECVREEDTVARLGGDEFVVMLVGLSESRSEAASQVELIGEKIITILNQSFDLRGVSYDISPSIGICVFLGQQTDIDTLLKQADLAMYKAKDAGRNSLRFFDPDMADDVLKRASLESDLRDAVQRNQFALHYQAQVSGSQVTGAEALLRWQHPTRGLVFPGDFISVIEETGLILMVGQWVLDNACKQLAAWATRRELSHLTVAVNISARQLNHEFFADQVLAALDRSGANPQRLKLELTESLLVNNIEDIISKMTVLKAKGVAFSLDDFGTGYSSLAYLKRLPLDQLKIDQSFVRDILIDTNDAAIARMIVVLADTLGLAVIAEGVETEAQRDALAQHGCHAYQGYLFSRPMPPEEFERFVRHST